MSAARRTSSARPHKARGFTLIEVLAALVLIGVVLPVAMRGVSIALLTAGRARHTGEACELARSKLAELSLAADASGYTGSGDFGTDWPDYSWTSVPTTREYGVTEIAVTVKWKSRGQDESIVLSTLAYPGAMAASTTTTDGTATGTGTPSTGTPSGGTP